MNKIDEKLWPWQSDVTKEGMLTSAVLPEINCFLRKLTPACFILYDLFLSLTPCFVYE